MGLEIRTDNEIIYPICSKETHSQISPDTPEKLAMIESKGKSKDSSAPPFPVTSFHITYPFLYHENKIYTILKKRLDCIYNFHIFGRD